MNSLPVIACGIAIVLAVLFEVSYAYIDKRYDTPFCKDTWLFGFWAIVISTLICSDIMLLKSPEITHWVPFGVVVALHLYTTLSGVSFSRLSITPPQKPPTSTPPPVPVNPNGHDIHISQKPKATNK